MRSHKKVLIIDDNPDTLKLIQDILEESHFDCQTAASPSEGLSSAATWKPDLILLDLMMPVMSGLGFLRQIKTMTDLSRIPIIILTSLGDREVATEAMDLGACAFLRKACHPKEIVSAVQEYVAA